MTNEITEPSDLFDENGIFIQDGFRFNVYNKNILVLSALK